MKKSIKIILTVIIIISVAIAGFVVGKNSNNYNEIKTDGITDKEGYIANEVVGVYENDSWNGKYAMLAIYEDGTCQYPTRSTGTWIAENDKLILTIRFLYSDDYKLTMNAYFDVGISSNDVDKVMRDIKNMKNVEEVRVRSDEEKKWLYIKLYETEENDETYTALNGINEIVYVEYPYGIIEEYDDHEAVIMADGIVLHGHFFRKVSN